MAKMSLREVADRANLQFEEASEALAKMTSRNAERQVETATEFAERGLARLRSLKAEPLEVRNIRVPKDTRLSASFGQGLLILSLFPIAGDELLGIADIGDALGMSRSTVHRYVTTLVFYGLLEQPEGTRKYRRPQVEHSAAAAMANGDVAKAAGAARDSRLTAVA
jgi:hypothetical protein